MSGLTGAAARSTGSSPGNTAAPIAFMTERRDNSV